MSPPTPEQEAALTAVARGGATTIAAGAGAGKTTLMVEAVWRDVERDRIPLERILVAAYNRAAAAHLSARLQARFADPDDGRGTGRPGIDLSAAWVGTFHSIAARIVREHPFTAGVDPAFGELDDVEAAALAEQALDESMELSMADPGFLEVVSAAPSLAGLRDATRRAHERLRAAGHETPVIQVPDAPGPDPATLAALEDAMAAVAADPSARPDHHGVLEDMRAMLLGGEAGASVPKLPRNCAKALKPLCEVANDLAAQVWQAWVDQEARVHLLAFAAYLDRFARRYAELKAERGALDYEDLLLGARRVLRAGVSYGFARVYVDEFQDANRLQADIVDLLAGERTVVVGDGCQAIYGFRHADAAQFVARAGDPPEVTLRDNHRSQPSLMASLNGVLGTALAGEATFAPLRAAADPTRPGPVVADAPVELIDVVSDEPPTRDQEAVVVAERVAQLVDAGYAYRDIAVVFRALTMVEPYRAALAARGIPAHLVAGRGFFTHDQVADTMALLSLVENPHDEEGLIRVLASPYFGAGDDDLLAVRRAAGAADRSGWPASGALWPALPATEVSRPLADVVRGLRPLLRERGLAGLVEAAVGARDYDLAVLGLPDGARRYANLRRLVRMADAHAAVRGPDLRGFLAVLRTMAEAGNQDPGEATLVDPGLKAVRLTTIHGVKGQEFPAVVIADGSHGTPTDAPMVIVERDGRAAIRVSRVGGDATQALGYRAALDRATDAAAAEERRVIYVASTRAERHLAVVGRSAVGGRAKNAAFQVLHEAAGLAGPGIREYEGGGRVALRIEQVAAPDGPAARPRVVPAPPRDDITAPPLAAFPAPSAVAGRRLSFSALDTLETCARRFHLEYERGLRGRPEDGVAGPGTGAASAWGGTAFGDLVHRRLARHDWAGPPPAPGWAAGDAAAAGLPPSPVDAERAERQVAGLLASALAARIRAGRPAVETPFAHELDGVILAGAIDLLVDEGDGRALILDWKTHALGNWRTAADVAAGYELQQALYALVALRAGWSEVAVAWIALEDVAASPMRTLGAGDVGALEDEVRRALAPLAEPARPPAATTPQPICGGCPGLVAGCPVAAARTA